MIHLAILHKQFLDMIIEGTKTIESRWAKNKIVPFERINKGDILFLKESAKEVKAIAEVDKVLFFDNLDKEKVNKIITKYGGQIGLQSYSYKDYKEKNYCTLVFLKNVKQIKPFSIEKNNRMPWVIVNKQTSYFNKLKEELDNCF